MLSLIHGVLAIQAVVFPVWIYLAFRWLWALRADAVAESKSAMPGLGPTLRAFRGGLVSTRHARDRLRLGVLTVILLFLSSLHLLLI